MVKKLEPQFQGGAPVKNNHFESDEDLYRRFRPNALQDGRKLSLDAIALPDMSVNREACSEPKDALYVKGREFRGWGVAAFCVGDVPADVHVDGVVFDFRVEHDPCPEQDPKNFAHSIVAAYSDDIHVVWDPADASLDETIATMHYKWRFRMQQQIRRFPVPPDAELAAARPW